MKFDEQRIREEDEAYVQEKKSKEESKQVDNISSANADCPDAAECKGENKLRVKPAFLYSRRTSPDFYPCNKLLRSCMGGEGDGENICGEYYTGIKCEACKDLKMHYNLQNGYSQNLLIVKSYNLSISTFFLILLIFLMLSATWIKFGLSYNAS